MVGRQRRASISIRSAGESSAWSAMMCTGSFRVYGYMVAGSWGLHLPDKFVACLRKSCPSLPHGYLVLDGRGGHQGVYVAELAGRGAAVRNRGGSLLDGVAGRPARLDVADLADWPGLCRDDDPFCIGEQADHLGQRDFPAI